MRFVGDDGMAKLIEITGKALSGEWGIDDEIGTGVPVLRTTNFTNEGVVNYENVVTRIINKKNISEKYLQPGDIILEKSGGSDKQPVGRVIYYEGPLNTYLFNNFTGLLRVQNQKEWYPRYVFYSLFSNYRKGGTRAFENKTTGLHNLKVDDYVSRHEVVNVEYSLQVDMCDRLDRIAKIIQVRKQELQKLDDLVKARFVEMFGDPVTKQEKKVKLVNIGKVYTGNTPSMKIPEYYESNDIPFIKPGDISESGVTIIQNTGSYISESGRKVARVMPQGSILVTCIGTIGKVAIASRESSCNQQINFIVPNENYNSVYLAYCLSFFKKVLTEMSNAPVVPIINKSQFSAMEISVVPKPEQDDFASFVSLVDKSKVVVQKALDEAQLLFNSLLQQYFG